MHRIGGLGRLFTALLSICCGMDFINAEDSLQFIFNQDTISIPRTYTLDFPAYEEIKDSTIDQVTQRADQDLHHSDLSARGSISRGIQISSNASVSLQSSLYLKISGDLGSEYKVDGVLTERTAPLQPIGNTRRLNDFDRVLVNIRGPSLTASIGDIQLNKSPDKFGRLQRSIEGIDTEIRAGKGRADASIGFSYGQYVSQHIQGKEGKQGPYRLSGKNGEKFIIILAESERVELDGQILQRGDYIIDYNAAELSFSHDHMISSNSRIMVEFEYVPDIYLANYSFGKQVLSASASMGEPDETPFRLSASIKQFKDDAKNPLGDIDQELLSNVFQGIPDTSTSTWLSTIVEDSINGNYILNENLLIFAGDGLGSHRASFSFVGLEEGEYRKVVDQGVEYFEHDPVVGEYLPAQKLISPQSHSVLSFGSQYSGNVLHFHGDYGISRKVNNLYAEQILNRDKHAWDISAKVGGRSLNLTLGETYYDQGFASFDALESNEFYRQWRIAPRLEEKERHDYAAVSAGSREANFLYTELSRLSRNDSTAGEQLNIQLQTDPENRMGVHQNSHIVTDQDGYDQQHAVRTFLKTGPLRTEWYGNLEEGFGSTFFQNNDHTATGLAFHIQANPNHQISAQADLRRDYRGLAEGKSLFDQGTRRDWTEQRQDLSAEYAFQNKQHINGRFQFKYREHQSDSSGKNTYALGNLNLNVMALEDQFRYAGRYLLDEEHIPRYDFQYVLVDTGYGDYSYDPIAREYLPVSGGRFIRQRLFSDREEQVRKIESKSHFEYASKTFRGRERTGFRVALDVNTQQKNQVDTDMLLQGQELYRLSGVYRFDDDNLLRELSYNGRQGSRISALYNFGLEESEFTNHEAQSVLQWNTGNRSTLGTLIEKRVRNVEYNSSAREDWSALRPYLKHTYTLSARQQVTTELKYSSISDTILDESYDESFVLVNHRIRVGRRGSLDQKAHYSQIRSNASGIPYSVFSGRQPGTNWKYILNGRYTFSNRFQLSLNYSLEKRGEGAVEQFMRLEGRTSF